MPTNAALVSESARLEHERLTSLINSMADGVIAVDEEARVLLYNGAALNILDVNTIAKHRSLGSVMKPIDRNNTPVDIVELVKSVSLPTTNRDLRLPYGEKDFINLYVSIAPVHLGYGTRGQRGFVLLLRDITREKSLEEERDEFISVVSHELRTPIAIAEGNISNAQLIAERQDLDPQIKQALSQAHDQVMFLADMINDLSTLSRAERGKLTLEIEPINIHELMTDLANSYRDEAAGKGLKLIVHTDAHLELLYSSRLYVREVLQNFITNAIKYTPAGHVGLRATVAAGGVEFAVSDSGIGISKADQEKVFDKFFRSEDYRTRATNGTGLGLYVTMKLARLLHAEISLESELNKGSTFKVLVPNLKS